MKGASHGYGVIAEEQSQGRGRNQRTWHSLKGGSLLCSIILRPKLAAVDFPKITLAAGLAAAETIEQLVDCRIFLKWPNDLFLDDKKCGGILTESSSMNNHDGMFAVVGIGLNLITKSDDLPESLEGKITSIHASTGQIVKALELYAVLHKRLLRVVSELEQGHFLTVLERWKKRDLLCDKRMHWIDITGKIVSGKGVGPDRDGFYHIEGDNGEIVEVLSGDLELAGQIGFC